MIQLTRVTQPGRLRPGVLLLALAVTVAGCGETSPSATLAVGGIAVVGSPTVNAAAGQTLPETAFQVRDANQQPLPGITVTFAATGTGAVANPSSAVTDASGVATTRWTMPVTTGASMLTATAGGASAQVAATVVAAAPARLEAASPTAQLGTAGADVTQVPSVRVFDAFDNPVVGAQVTFQVFAGGGSATDFVSSTNNDGIAAVGAWRLGPTAGNQSLLARVEAPNVAGNPVIFNAVAVAGSAAQITAASPASQTGTVGGAVAAPPAVIVRDAVGNPVANVAVTFAVTGGGQVGAATASTDAQGRASAGSWTLGPQAGAQTVTASAPGAGSVQFVATAGVGAATQLTIAAGNNQTAQVTRAVPVAPRVLVRDAAGNPVSGVAVEFQVASGGGTAISGRQVTDIAGVAEVGAWFLGGSPGTNTLTASAAGLTTVTFTATATPGQAASLAAASATTQSAVAGSVVDSPPAVVIRDAVNNPVPGVAVTFTVTAGGGSLTTGAAGTPASSVTVTTDAAGRAAVTTWRLGTTLASNVVTASAPGLAMVTFTATPLAAPPASVVAAGGINATAVQGTAVANRPSVRVLDQAGNVVAGARVQFSVLDGGGTITGGTQTTDATGVATVGSWILGASPSNELRALVVDSAGAPLSITGNPVLFQARSAVAVDITTAPAAVSLGTQFTIVVYLEDALGQTVPLNDIPLTIQMTGGGTLTGTTVRTTDANGRAVFNLSVSGSVGDRTFTVSGAGLTADSATITFN